MRVRWLFVLLVSAVVVLDAAVGTDPWLRRSSRVRAFQVPLPLRWSLDTNAPADIDSALLEAQIRRFSGHGAINCGRVGGVVAEQEVEAGISCAVDAARRRVGFSASRGYFDGDAYSAEGVIGIPRGGVLFFTYIRGAVMPLDASFTVELCDTPVAVDRVDGKAFGCDD